MYRSLRIIRIIIALVCMALPAWALMAGYDSVVKNMQILTALLSGSLLCLVVWIVATLIYGRVYCSLLCPLGTAMDGISLMSRLLRKKPRTYSYLQPANTLRIVFLSLAVIFILSGYGLLPVALDPYSEYALMVEEFLCRPLGRNVPAVAFTMSAFALAATVFVAVVAAAWKMGRLWCNTVCPVGSVLALAARRPVFHMEIDPDKCIDCGECERVCKCHCIKIAERHIDTSRCVVCFDCAAECPANAIIYRSGRYTLRTPMMQTSEKS